MKVKSWFNELYYFLIVAFNAVAIGIRWEGWSNLSTRNKGIIDVWKNEWAIKLIGINCQRKRRARRKLKALKNELMSWDVIWWSSWCSWKIEKSRSRNGWEKILWNAQENWRWIQIIFGRSRQNLAWIRRRNWSSQGTK